MKASADGLTPVEETALFTLYARALDNRWQRPILADSSADELCRNLDYDFDALSVRASVWCPVALRAKLLDQQVRDFIGVHPDAVVVDLGAGLSDTYLRVRPPATVDWYDVDLPAVITLRQQLLPPREHEHAVATRIGDVDWADAIPSDRPTFLVADGLTGFLSQPVLLNLFHTVTDHFRTGELAFNDYGPIGLATRVAVKIAPQRFGAFTPTNPGFADPRTPEKWNPRLTLVQETHLASASEVEHFPATLRTGVRLMKHVPALSRQWRVLRYRF